MRLQLLTNVSIEHSNPTLLTLNVPKYTDDEVDGQCVHLTAHPSHFWQIICQCLKGKHLLAMLDDIINTQPFFLYEHGSYLQCMAQQDANIASAEKKMQLAMHATANQFWRIVQHEKDAHIHNIRRRVIHELSLLPYKHLHQMALSDPNLQLITAMKNANLTAIISDINKYLINLKWHDDTARALSTKLVSMLNVLNIDNEYYNLEECLSNNTAPTTLCNKRRRKSRKRKREQDEHDQMMYSVPRKRSKKQRKHKKRKNKAEERAEYAQCQMSPTTINNIHTHFHLYSHDVPHRNSPTVHAHHREFVHADDDTKCHEMYALHSKRPPGDTQHRTAPNVSEQDGYYPLAEPVRIQHDDEQDAPDLEAISGFKSKQSASPKPESTRTLTRKRKRKRGDGGHNRSIRGKRSRERKENNVCRVREESVFSNQEVARIVREMHANAQFINTLSHENDVSSMHSSSDDDNDDDDHDDHDDSDLLGLVLNNIDDDCRFTTKRRADWHVFREAIEQENEVNFYNMHMYFDPVMGKNLLFLTDNDENYRRERFSLHGYRFKKECNDWWNEYANLKFEACQYDDPGICEPTSTSSTVCRYNKQTCYRAPPVFQSWRTSPKSAPFPYVVKQPLTSIADAAFIKKALSVFWRQRVVVVSRPRIEEFASFDEEEEGQYRDKKTTLRLHQVFRINDKMGDELKRLCAQNEHEEEEEDDDDDDESDIDVQIAARMEKYSPFTIGDIYLGGKAERDSLREYLKFDDAEQCKQDELWFLSAEHDALNGQHQLTMHVASYGARTPWHHDLGLCTWLQILYGEKNVKIWDVHSTRKIEQYKNDESLDDTQKQRFIQRIHPKWELFVRCGVVLYLPAGCGHLVTTTSEVAIMATGSFMPHNQLRIGYEMAHYEDKGYLKSQDLDWDNIIERVTTSMTSAPAHSNKEVSMPDRLQHLERNTLQLNWNASYVNLADLDWEEREDQALLSEIQHDLNNLRRDYQQDMKQLAHISQNMHHLSSVLHDDQQSDQEVQDIDIVADKSSST